jgi:hypothetical protein
MDGPDASAHRTAADDEFVVSPRTRTILIRTARALIVTIALLAPWPGLGRAYAAAWGAVGTTLAWPFFSGMDALSLTASSAATSNREWSLMVHVDDALTGAPKHLGAVDVRRSGYLQIAFYLAAAAAFPIAGWRRFVPMALGGVVLLSMLGWLPVLMYLATKQVIHPGAAMFSALAVAQRSLSGAPGMSVVVPGLLWLGALRLQRGSGEGSAATPAAEAR